MLFSTGKYKSGLKSAAAICVWLVMIVGTVTLLSWINPGLMARLTETAESETTQDADVANPIRNHSGSSQPCLSERVNRKHPYYRRIYRRRILAGVRRMNPAAINRGGGPRGVVQTK